MGATITKYAGLDAELRDLEDCVELVKKQREALQQAALEEFVAEGLDSVKIGGVIYFPKRSLFVGPVDGNKEALIKGLKKAKLSVYLGISINTRGLGVYVKEMQQSKKKLPKALQDTLKVAEVFSVGRRKA